MRKVIYIASVVYLFILTSKGECAFDIDFLNAGPQGMGEAYTAYASDINSMSYNPAGLARSKKYELLFSYKDFYEMNLLSQKYIGFAAPGRYINLGFNWNRVGTTRNVEFIDYGEDTFCLSLAGELKHIKNLALGTNLKFYKATSQSNCTGYAADAGVQWYDIGDNKLSLGLFIENFNKPGIYWDTGAEDTLDPNLKMGMSLEPVENLFYAIDYDIENRLNLGIELRVLKENLFLRTGIKNMLEDEKSLTMGMGFNVGGIHLDYALSRHSSLGSTHMVSLIMSAEKEILPSFEKKEEKETRPPEISIGISTDSFRPKIEDLQFEISGELEKVMKWSLNITNVDKNKIVKIFEGEGPPERSIIWNGKDDIYQEYAPEGKYSCTLYAVDEQENMARTEEKYFEVVYPSKPEVKRIVIRKIKGGLKIDMQSRVLFDFGKYKLKPEGKKTVDEAAEILREYPESDVLIEGHTDSVGSAGFNKKLSEKRAQQVFIYLRDEYNFEPDRFTIKGYGESKPIASNRNEEGRAKNRRVEIKILRK